MKLRSAAIVVTTLCVLVAGCGTKGPLYVPGVPIETPWPYLSARPAPVAPQPKPADVPGASDEKK
jgi:hypothetical protein